MTISALLLSVGLAGNIAGVVGGGTRFGRENRLKVEFLAPPPPSSGICYRPVSMRLITNGPDREATVHVKPTARAGHLGGGFFISEAHASVTAGLSPSTLEIPLYLGQGRPYEYETSVFLGGEEVATNKYPAYAGWHGRQEALIIGRFEGLDAFKTAIDARGAQGTVISPETAVGHWQCYLGTDLVAAAAAVVERLSPRQQQALSRWVRFGGGRLWLFGQSARETARSLDLLPTSASIWQTKEDGLKISLYRSACGTLALQTEGGPGRLASDSRSFASFHNAFTSQQPAINVRDQQASVFRSLFEGLHEVPVFGYCVLSLIFAVVIGPVNFILLRRRGRSVLFYFTAPAIALGGMLILALYSLAAEGLATKYNEAAWYVHDVAGGEGCVYQARVYFCGIAPRRGLWYPENTAALPFSRKRENVGLTVDWTHGQKLLGGWLRSRTLSGLYTATPVQARMGVEIQSSPAGVNIVNGLPSTLTTVYVRLAEDGEPARYYTARGVPPGAETAVTPILGEPRAVYTGRGCRGADISNADWLVYAETSGLPYLEDGGINGTVINGRYYYLAVRPKRKEPAGIE